MVPGEGIEPPTFGLQNRCSTAELTRHKTRKWRISSAASAVPGRDRNGGKSVPGGAPCYRRRPFGASAAVGVRAFVADGKSGIGKYLVEAVALGMGLMPAAIRRRTVTDFVARRSRPGLTLTTPRD